MESSPIAACPACLSPDFRTTLEVSGFPIARCSRCSHRFVSAVLPDELLAAAYGAEYYGGKCRPQDSNSKGYTDYLGNLQHRLAAFKMRLDIVFRHRPTAGDLLDYGSAVGLFVKTANENGWRAVGYERSSWAVDFGREQLGLDIRLANNDQAPFDAESFDVVTLWDVAEHLTDPRKVLSQIHRWLRPGGIIALNTINISAPGAALAGRNWRHLAPPWHLQFFTRKSLLRLLTEKGFEVVAATGEGAVLECGSEPPSASIQRVERILQHWRIRRLASALNLFDEIMIVARKSENS